MSEDTSRKHSKAPRKPERRAPKPITVTNVGEAIKAAIEADTEARRRAQAEIMARIAGKRVGND